MELPRLNCECNCGQTVQPHILCLTARRQLLVIGHCLKCGEQVQTVFKLMDLLRHCPKLPTKRLQEEDNQAIKEASTTDFSPQDLQWLNQMKIGE